MKRQIGASFLLLEKMLATSITLPIEMLRAAEGAARAKNKQAQRLNLTSVAESTAPVPTQSGFNLIPDTTTADDIQTDMLIIPALWRNPNPVIRKSQSTISWLKHLHEQGTIIIGVGTGCCLMAEAGLLDGKPATTHWHYFDRFSQAYPEVELKRQYFITQSKNLYCAGSVNAVADLTVHFIRRIYGADIAHHVQTNFSHEIRKDYAATSYYDDRHRYHPDEDIVQIQIWLQDNYSKAVNIQQLAKRFGLSQRNLNRRFKAATNQTPTQYLQEIRIDAAKELLQHSNLTVQEIADRVGYKDMASFIMLFKRILSSTPGQYRATVRSKLFNPNIDKN